MYGEFDTAEDVPTWCRGIFKRDGALLSENMERRVPDKAQRAAQYSDYVDTIRFPTMEDYAEEWATRSPFGLPVVLDQEFGLSP